MDDTPGFDHDAWRTPKIRGQVQPLSERRDIASSWSPRQANSCKEGVEAPGWEASDGEGGSVVAPTYHLRVLSAVVALFCDVLYFLLPKALG